MQIRLLSCSLNSSRESFLVCSERKQPKRIEQAGIIYLKLAHTAVGCWSFWQKVKCILLSAWNQWSSKTKMTWGAGRIARMAEEHGIGLKRCSPSALLTHYHTYFIEAKQLQGPASESVCCVGEVVVWMKCEQSLVLRFCCSSNMWKNSKSSRCCQNLCASSKPRQQPHRKSSDSYCSRWSQELWMWDLSPAAPITWSDLSRNQQGIGSRTYWVKLSSKIGGGQGNQPLQLHTEPAWSGLYILISEQCCRLAEIHLEPVGNPRIEVLIKAHEGI